MTGRRVIRYMFLSFLGISMLQFSSCTYESIVSSWMLTMLYVTQVPIYGLYKYPDLDNLKQVYRGRCQREGLITWLRNFLLEVGNWKFTAWRFNWGPLTPLARPGETRVAGPIREQTCSFDQDEVKITMKMMKFRIQDHDLGVFDYGLYMCTRPMQKKTVKCEPWTQFLLSVTYLIAFI